MSALRHSVSSEEGFTIMEILIAIPILIVGLLAMGLLAARMMAGSRGSKYMSLAATLTSEKIEDLNRFAFDDPQVCVPSANSTSGSLSSDISLTVTCPSVNGVIGKSGSVTYFDDVSMASTAGAVAETVSNPGPTYVTTSHAPDGSVTVTGNTVPSPTTFHRRWIIEKDAPVPNVRRITVLVTLADASLQPGVSFQMSWIRP